MSHNLHKNAAAARTGLLFITATSALLCRSFRSSAIAGNRIERARAIIASLIALAAFRTPNQSHDVSEACLPCKNVAALPVI